MLRLLIMISHVILGMQGTYRLKCIVLDFHFRAEKRMCNDGSSGSLILRGRLARIHKVNVGTYQNGGSLRQVNIFFPPVRNVICVEPTENNNRRQKLMQNLDGDRLVSNSRSFYHDLSFKIHSSFGPIPLRNSAASSFVCWYSSVGSRCRTDIKY